MVKIFFLLSFIFIIFGEEVYVYKGYNLISIFNEVNNKDISSDITLKQESLKLVKKLRKHLILLIDKDKIGSVYYPLEDILFSFNNYYLQLYKLKDNEYIINACYFSETSQKEISKRIVVAHGGGKNYWNITYNFKNKKFGKININQPW